MTAGFFCPFSASAQNSSSALPNSCMQPSTGSPLARSTCAIFKARADNRFHRRKGTWCNPLPRSFCRTGYRMRSLPHTRSPWHIYRRKTHYRMRDTRPPERDRIVAYNLRAVIKRIQFSIHRTHTFVRKRFALLHRRMCHFFTFANIVCLTTVVRNWSEVMVKHIPARAPVP